MNSALTNTHPTLLVMKKYTENWVMLSLVIFLLGYFFFPSSSKQNTFFYIAVCTPAVLLLPHYYKQLRPTTWVTASAIILLCYLFLNSLWSIHYSTSQSLKYLRYLFTLYCLFAAIFVLQYKRPGYSIWLFKAFVIIGFFHSIYGIFDHLITEKDPLLTRLEDPIDSAMHAGLLLLTCLWLMFEKKAWKHKLTYIGLSVPFIILILLSKSRGPQLALLLTLPLAIYFQKLNIKKIIPLASALLIVFCLLLLFTDASKILFSRGLSFPYRQEIWMTSLKESLNYFWLGQGASHKPPLFLPSGSIFNHSHSILLSIFRLGGIVGVLLFSINFILCLFVGFKSSHSPPKLWVIWLVFGTLCLMTNGKYPLARPSSMWLAYWIPIAFICAYHSKYLANTDKE
jgi:O-antigen ligase